MQGNGATVMLVAFYNKKALGVRYLETALKRAGYRVVTVFYKDFNSIRPKKTTEQELVLLREQIEKENPILIGLSVMSSMYLDTVRLVMDTVTKNFTIPVVCGGVYATMFPEQLIESGAAYVIRADGERPICMLADAICNKADVSRIPSLCYKANGRVVCNELGGISADIDAYGLPAVHSENACFIDGNTLMCGDPQLDTRSYEVVASRGCPFTCSYCCCVNLRRLFPKGTSYVRTRSVESVIEELKLAKRTCKKLVFVHFYDEIFPNLPGWVDEFVEEYQKHVGLPFTIWSHPKMVDTDMLRKFVSAGLTEVIMGIQSGCEHIRKDVFHRYETQQDIIGATRAIRSAGVTWATYDFMLQHPFETTQDLQETYWLVKRLCPPFALQLHGLNFLPGTDIVNLAIEQNYFTQEELMSIMYAPMEEQFGTYWKRDGGAENRLWYQMIYCLQFRPLRRLMSGYEHEPVKYRRRIQACYWAAGQAFRMRQLQKKAHFVWKSIKTKYKGGGSK